MLDELGLGDHYLKLANACHGDTLPHVKALGLAGLASLGIPKLKVGRLWQRVEELCFGRPPPQTPAANATTSVAIATGALRRGEEARPNELSALLDAHGLAEHYDALRDAANGVTLPHLKLVTQAGAVALGVPKIRAAKLWREVEDKCKGRPPPPPAQQMAPLQQQTMVAPEQVFYQQQMQMQQTQMQQPRMQQTWMQQTQPFATPGGAPMTPYGTDVTAPFYTPATPIAPYVGSHPGHAITGPSSRPPYGSVSEAGWAAVAASGGVPASGFGASFSDAHPEDDRAALYVRGAPRKDRHLQRSVRLLLTPVCNLHALARGFQVRLSAHAGGLCGEPERHPRPGRRRWRP